MGSITCGAEPNMSNDYIPLEEAAQRSGLHPNTLRRLLREGVISGYKASYGGKRHWLVSAASLKHYADPVVGFLLDLPGPKIFLKKSGS
jgi:excisionase family DNA binding protein